MKTIDRSHEFRFSEKSACAGATLILSAVLALLAGCASTAPTGTNANVNLSGFPPAFKSGYADGCSSAAATPRKDAARFRTDAQYAQGWRDGFDICKRR